MKNYILPTTVALLINMSLVSCSSDSNDQALNSNKIRLTSIKESAIAYGAQSGLAWQSKKINKKLALYNKEFGEIFNFNAMIMHHNVLPPILRESKSGLNIADHDTLRLSDKIIEIVAQARFVTTPPSWRDYLTMTYKSPDKPPKTLLPKNRQERRIWNQYVKEGWDNGYNQANAILQENLGKITQDFTGMALYHSLYAQNMVSAPFVASASLGITGNKKHMVINDKLLKITSHADLLPGQSQHWHPALSKKGNLKKKSYYGKK